MDRRRALITGIGGQDGAYLTKLLLEKDYYVVGMELPGHGLLSLPGGEDLNGAVELIHGDVARGAFVQDVIATTRPHEIYHLAGRSHVGESFADPVQAVEINAVGTMNVLNALGPLQEVARPRVMLASSCEVFGPGDGTPMDEDTKFNPQSPYALSKELALKAAFQARELYALHISNGIFFNHESPLRPANYVTRKISAAVAAIEAGSDQPISLGNLDAKRDWGHAADFVEGMWRMLQQPAGGDYILATGQTHSVRDFVDHAFKKTGKTVVWDGEGTAERGMDEKTGRVLVLVDPAFFRPKEVPARVGDASKAERVLGWRPRISFDELVEEMLHEDRKLLAGNHF